MVPPSCGEMGTPCRRRRDRTKPRMSAGFQFQIDILFFNHNCATECRIADALHFDLIVSREEMLEFELAFGVQRVSREGISDDEHCSCRQWRSRVHIEHTSMQGSQWQDAR